MILSRGCGPHYFSCVNPDGLMADFSVTVEDDFPDQAVTADWTPVSGCTITNVVVESERTIDGISYKNVVIGRFSGMSTAAEAVSRLSVTGIDTSELIPYDIRIRTSVPS